MHEGYTVPNVQCQVVTPNMPNLADVITLNQSEMQEDVIDNN